jgi:hypothetical protein
MGFESPHVDPIENESEDATETSASEKTSKSSRGMSNLKKTVLASAVLTGAGLGIQALDNANTEAMRGEGNEMAFKMSANENFGIRGTDVEMQKDGSANLTFEGQRFHISSDVVNTLTGKEINHEQVRDPNMIQGPDRDWSLKWLSENGEQIK